MEETMIAEIGGLLISGVSGVALEEAPRSLQEG
jgi:hypothetical protein